MHATFEEQQDDVITRNSKIKKLQDANDRVVSRSVKELTFIMTRLRVVSMRYGFQLNQDKTKVMIVDRPINNQLGTPNIAGFQTVEQSMKQLFGLTNYKHMNEGEKKLADVQR